MTPKHVKFQTCRCGRFGPRLRLRFDAAIRNRGPGVLELKGENPEMRGKTKVLASVSQALYRTRTPDRGAVHYISRPSAVLWYETNDTHAHFHLKNAVDYILSRTGTATGRARFAKAESGWCLGDSRRTAAWAPRIAFYTRHYPTPAYCGHGAPESQTVRMGIQPGWSDVYPQSRAFQWIDVSAMPPGSYRLRARVDPDDVIAEENEANNSLRPSLSRRVVIPGYKAVRHSVTLDATEGRREVTLRLKARRWVGSAPSSPRVGDPEFAVIRHPAGGRLIGWRPGKWRRTSRVRYVADARRSPRCDSFVYAVRNAASRRFPTSASAARVVVCGRA